MYALIPSNMFVLPLFFQFHMSQSKGTSHKRAALVANGTKVCHRFCNTECWSKLPPVTAKSCVCSKLTSTFYN